MSTAKALEIWTAQTLCDIGILLSIISFCLHIGRPYFERILSRFTLRVAADLWWIVYVALRDGSLFIALLFGILNLNMDLMADIKIGLPFVPFGTVLLAAALVWKVFRNTEDVNWAFRVSTWLVSIGALLNTLGYVLVMEAPGEEYAAAKTRFWQTMVSWRSNANPELAATTFYLAFSALACLAGTALVMAIRLYGRTADGKQEHVQTST
ncbi:MAG TPA: hypothetical protein VE398_12730 [Acidobacteriota bacterium]|nr:hypothetical protein [Acidobacteriota bacterium]